MLSWVEHEKSFITSGPGHISYGRIMKQMCFDKSFEPGYSISYKIHYENTPIQIYWKLYNQKRENFQTKIMIFFIFLLKKLIVGTR